MADFLGGVRHFFGSRNLYDALGVANDATGYLFSKHISSVEGSVMWFDEKTLENSVMLANRIEMQSP